jgi:histidine triad (HIT) family protein
MKDIFCQIVAGDIPCQKVYETDNVLALRDINPKAPVHVLIIPKKHLTGLNEASEEDQMLLGEILLVASKVAELEGLSDRGYRLIANSGRDGGQLVPHLHFHLLGGKALGPKLTTLES